MSITQFLQRCNEKNIKVISGDLLDGFWDFDGRCLSRTSSTGALDKVELSGNLKRAEVHNKLEKNQYEPLMGAGVGALIGLELFSVPGALVGAVAGHLFTRHNDEVSINIHLKDGRKFMAVMWPSVLQQIRVNLDK